MICSSANWRTISMIARCSSVCSLKAAVSTAMAPTSSITGLGGYRRQLASDLLEHRLRVDPGIDRLHRRPPLEQGLLVLVLGVGLHHDRATDSNRRRLAVHHDRADDDVEIATATEAEVADRARVDAAGLALEAVDQLHR